MPAGEIYFITICCVKRTANQLAEPKTFETMVAALKHCATAEKIWPTLFLAMPDHLHLLASFPRQIEMAKVIRDWKRFVAKQTGIVWQDGFFDHRLRNNESLEEKSNYVRVNPVRPGLVSAPHLWNYVWPDCNVAPAR